MFLAVSFGNLGCGENVPLVGFAPVESPAAPAFADGGVAALLPPCTPKRFKALYTSPGNLNLGQGTSVEAEVITGTPVAPHHFTWWVRNDDVNTARGALALSGDCQLGSASCARFTCTGMGGNATVDPVTGMPVAGVWVLAKYEDDTCYDTASVLLRCTVPGAAAP
jgi:hypothetical protein